MRILYLILALAIGACSCSTTPQSDLQQIESSCTIVTAAADVIKEMNNKGKLSPSQQSAVLEALLITDPICGANDPPTLDDVKRAAFRRAIEILQDMAANKETVTVEQES